MLVELSSDQSAIGYTATVCLCYACLVCHVLYDSMVIVILHLSVSVTYAHKLCSPAACQPLSAPSTLLEAAACAVSITYTGMSSALPGGGGGALRTAVQPLVARRANEPLPSEPVRRWDR